GLTFPLMALVSTGVIWLTCDDDTPDLPRKFVRSDMLFSSFGMPFFEASSMSAFEPGSASETCENLSAGILFFASPSMEPAPRIDCDCDRPGTAFPSESSNGAAELSEPGNPGVPPPHALTPRPIPAATAISTQRSTTV